MVMASPAWSQDLWKGGSPRLIETWSGLCYPAPARAPPGLEYDWTMREQQEHGDLVPAGEGGKLPSEITEAAHWLSSRLSFKNIFQLKIFLCSNFGEMEWCGGWRGLSSEHLPPIKSFRIALEKHLIGDNYQATCTDLILLWLVDFIDLILAYRFYTGFIFMKYGHSENDRFPSHVGVPLFPFHFPWTHLCGGNYRATGTYWSLLLAS